MSASPRRPSDRDTRVDVLLAEAFPGDPTPGRWLVAPSLPSVTRALETGGAEIHTWTRTAGDGVEPRPDPPAGPFDGVVLRIPRGSEAIRMALHLVAVRLAPTGRLIVGGANDEGIRGIAARIGEVVSEIGEPVPGNHARRIEGTGPRAEVRGALDDWAEPVEVTIAGEVSTFTSWPGLFAHGRLDTGTAFLLEDLPDPSGARALDFGCGIGVIGAVLQRRGARTVDLSDRDALAVHASRRNVVGTRVHCADGLPDPAGSEARWDLVVSNPPIHSGPDPDWSVLEALARSLPGRLQPGGQGILVTQVTVPIARLFGETFRSVERLRSGSGFAVWRIASPKG